MNMNGEVQLNKRWRFYYRIALLQLRKQHRVLRLLKITLN